MSLTADAKYKILINIEVYFKQYWINEIRWIFARQMNN